MAIPIIPAKLKMLADELDIVPAYVGGSTPLWAYVVKYDRDVCSKIIQYRNPDNRQMSQADMRNLSAEMLNGTFLLTGETVIFGLDANVCNGQTRLSAVINSGTEQEILTVFGVNQEKVFPVLDHGRKRSLKDALYRQDKEKKNLNLIASTIRAVWQLLNTHETRAGGLSSHTKPPDTSYLKMWEQHPDIEDAVKLIVGPANCLAFRAGPAFAAALLWILCRIDREEAINMYVNMAQGSMPLEAQWTAPRKFVKRVTSVEEEGEFSRVTYRALLIKTWNFFRLKESPERLAFMNLREDFPLIEGLAYKDGLPCDHRLNPLKKKK